MATYDINSLTVQNGKLYSNGVELAATDSLSYSNPAAESPEGTPTWLTGASQPTGYSTLPLWAMTPERIAQFLPSSPATPDGYNSLFGGATQDPTAYARSLLSQVGNSYAGQADPVQAFAATGDNRDALYGAYMQGNNTTTQAQQEGDIPWLNPINSTFSGSLFDRNFAIPDLATQWSGEAYSDAGQFVSPVSDQSAQEAQRILKMLYPNVSQEQLDAAAYSAMQSGDKYYNGTASPSENTQNAYYYGHGPLPVVTAIAKQLGMTPEAQQFLDSNWTQYADQYGALREEAKAKAKAEQQARMMSGIAGVAGVVGGAFGLSGLLNGGLAGMLGGAAAPVWESSLGLYVNPVTGAGLTADLASSTALMSGATGFASYTPEQLKALSQVTIDGGGNMLTSQTGGNMSLWDSITNGVSNMFGSGTPTWGSPEWMAAQDYANFGVEGVNALGNSLGYSQGLDWASPMLTEGQIAGMINSSPGLIDTVTKYLTQNPGSTLKTAMQALTNSGSISPNVISGLLSGVGGYLSGESAQDAAKTSADAQLEAARIAADAAKFRPVGVTTRFGQSQFGTDANGNVNSAGYTLSPDLKAQQDALMGMSGQMLSQYQNAPQAFAPMGVAGQRAMALGNQYLAQDPQAQAMKYMQDQQALLGTGRERDLNNMLTGEFNRGTYGLATGGTSTGMMNANPRLEAMFNAQRQQDLGLAAQATQGGMDYAKFGAGMVGTGGDLTNAMYQGQVNAFNPYKTALGGAQTIEGLGQNAMDLGVNLGKVTNNAQSGMLLANGMNQAAQTMQPSNSYSPWGALLSGAGNQVSNYQDQQAQQQQQQMMLAALGQKAGII